MIEPPRFPHPPIPEPQAAVIAAAGAPPLNLYRVLGLSPAMLDAWLGFFYALRGNCTTPRALRELMILRVAYLASCGYQWTQHERMARSAGVREAQIEEIPLWKRSVSYNNHERAALLLTDAIHEGRVSNTIHATCRAFFSDAEMIELIMTASAYCMVARVLAAIDVNTEGEEDAECERTIAGFNRRLAERE
jgi:AhpD family alkylhydroperoxidase